MAGGLLAERGASSPPDQEPFLESVCEWSLQDAKWVPDIGHSVSTFEAHSEGLLAFPFAILRKLWGRNMMTECARAPSSYTACFLRRRNDSRDMLGCAFVNGQR